MAYTIKFPEEINEQIVRELGQKIDPACYPGLGGDGARAAEIYRANNQTYIALLQDGSLIGYMSLLPISESAFSAIMREGADTVMQIGANDVLAYEPGKRYKLLIDALAVLPRRQKLAAAEMLVDAAFAFIATLDMRGIEVDEIIAYAPEEDLLPLMKKARLSKARTAADGTAVYSNKTTDRRRKETLSIRRKIDSVIALVADYADRPRKQVTGDTTFGNDLGLNPDDMAGLRASIEKRIGLQLTDSEYDSLNKIKDLASILQARG